MLYHLIRNAFICALVVLMPMSGRPERLACVSTWMVYSALFVLHSYPLVPVKGFIQDKKDGLSGFILLIMGNLVVMTSAVEFAYSPKLSSITSARGLIGGGLLLLGLAFRIWSVSVLGRSFSYIINNAPVLIRSGPYKWTRHPLYAGLIFVASSMCLVFGSYYGFLLVIIGLIPSFLYRIRLEEMALVVQFEDEYKQYMKESWALVPFIY